MLATGSRVFDSTLMVMNHVIPARPFDGVRTNQYTAS